MLIALPVCFGLGIFAIWMGSSLITSPAQCGFDAMSENDLCWHTGRSVENLVVDGAANGPTRRGEYTLGQQESANHLRGLLFLGSGLLAVVTIGLFVSIRFVNERRRRTPFRQAQAPT
ncbi:hypothetical protein HH308_09665 [Gordonia sp. TBRC 11910]|uniref:Transmembrane protein n=1 Tax=Gordonia asplenii TaxID=2725283 RepID=A0A848L1D6_9ACTN|nr:hypothetical protein [Gordonia asplenii]NMO01478.1 hypothetical protein [Gordonia asplenii]